jgi:6,7-dimethyl-8-ribityllumazine synthase
LTTARRVAVIVSRYNATVTDRLREGAVRVIESRLGSAEAAEVISAPGSYELPALALAAAESGRFAGVVALGCLIRGETRHDRYIAEAVAHGLVQVTMQTGVPAAFGVITAETAEQALARAGGKKGNKGEEATGALLDTIETIEAIRSGRPQTSPGVARPDKAGPVNGRAKTREAKKS